MFKKIKYLLRTPIQKDSAIYCIQKLPLNEEKPLEVIIQEHKEKRTPPQNRYYWRRLEEIARQAEIDKKKYVAKAWHIYCKENIMDDYVINKDGERVSKWIDLPLKGRTIISTTELEKESFAKYITQVEVFGVELNVRFSADYESN